MRYYFSVNNGSEVCETLTLRSKMQSKWYEIVREFLKEEGVETPYMCMSDKLVLDKLTPGDINKFNSQMTKCLGEFKSNSPMQKHYTKKLNENNLNCISLMNLPIDFKLPLHKPYQLDLFKYDQVWYISVQLDTSLDQIPNDYSVISEGIYNDVYKKLNQCSN